jgi:hypothetical protein
VKDEEITAKIRWQGGAHTTLEIPKPLPAPLERVTPSETLTRIRELTIKFRPKQIVDILNREGYATGTKQKFDVKKLHQIARSYGIKSYYNHLREEGKLTVKEMADRLGISTGTVIQWYKVGLLTGYVANDKGEYLFDCPGDKCPSKRQGEKLETRKKKLKNRGNDVDEV